jgi:GNAT superfamily N-acetyltransferase
MKVFSFSFETWKKKNFWNDDYESYSIIENDIMLANISVYRMKLLINGLEYDFLQIGAVATREEYRGRGFSRMIMQYIFNIYPNTPAFLFGNDSVLEFYPKFGFKQICDKKPYIEYRPQDGGEMTKLDITNPKVDYYLKERTQFSEIFDCKNKYSVNWFHLLMGNSDNIYEIPELQLMMVAEQQGSTLMIYDIAAIKPVSFSELGQNLHFKGVATIEFGFNPDWLDFDYSMKEYKIEDSTLFMKGDFGTEQEFIVPLLIRT